eukprot:ANDGO_03250.mRNA.1 hypothetical protein
MEGSNKLESGQELGVEHLFSGLNETSIETVSSVLKDFRRLLELSTPSQPCSLLREYLSRSPAAAEIMSVWDTLAENSQTNMVIECVRVLSLMLTCLSRDPSSGNAELLAKEILVTKRKTLTRTLGMSHTTLSAMCLRLLTRLHFANPKLISNTNALPFPTSNRIAWLSNNAKMEWIALFSSVLMLSRDRNLVRNYISQRQEFWVSSLHFITRNADVPDSVRMLLVDALQDCAVGVMTSVVGKSALLAVDKLLTPLLRERLVDESSSIYRSKIIIPILTKLSKELRLAWVRKFSDVGTWYFLHARTLEDDVLSAAASVSFNAEYVLPPQIKAEWLVVSPNCETPVLEQKVCLVASLVRRVFKSQNSEQERQFMRLIDGNQWCGAQLESTVHLEADIDSIEQYVLIRSFLFRFGFPKPRVHADLPVAVLANHIRDFQISVTDDPHFTMVLLARKAWQLLRPMIENNRLFLESEKQEMDTLFFLPSHSFYTFIRIAEQKKLKFARERVHPLLSGVVTAILWAVVNDPDAKGIDVGAYLMAVEAYSQHRNIPWKAPADLTALLSSEQTDVIRATGGMMQDVVVGSRKVSISKRKEQDASKKLKKLFEDSGIESKSISNALKEDLENLLFGQFAKDAVEIKRLNDYVACRSLFSPFSGRVGCILWKSLSESQLGSWQWLSFSVGKVFLVKSKEYKNVVDTEGVQVAVHSEVATCVSAFSSLQNITPDQVASHDLVTGYWIALLEWECFQQTSTYSEWLSSGLLSVVVHALSSTQHHADARRVLSVVYHRLVDSPDAHAQLLCDVIRLACSSEKVSVPNAAFCALAIRLLNDIVKEDFVKVWAFIQGRIVHGEEAHLADDDVPMLYDLLHDYPTPAMTVQVAEYFCRLLHSPTDVESSDLKTLHKRHVVSKVLQILPLRCHSHSRCLLIRAFCACADRAVIGNIVWTRSSFLAFWGILSQTESLRDDETGLILEAFSRVSPSTSALLALTEILLSRGSPTTPLGGRVLHAQICKASVDDVDTWFRCTWPRLSGSVKIPDWFLASVCAAMSKGTAAARLRDNEGFLRRVWSDVRDSDGWLVAAAWTLSTSKASLQHFFDVESIVKSVEGLAKGLKWACTQQQHSITE